MTASPYPPTRSQARCGSCQQPIRWVTTTAGHLMPLDPVPTADGNVIPVPGTADRYGDPTARVLRKSETVPAGTLRFTSHWATCATAAQHRKPKASKGT